MGKQKVLRKYVIAQYACQFMIPQLDEQGQRIPLIEEGTGVRLRGQFEMDKYNFRLEEPRLSYGYKACLEIMAEPGTEDAPLGLGQVWQGVKTRVNGKLVTIDEYVKTIQGVMLEADFIRDFNPAQYKALVEKNKLEAANELATGELAKKQAQIEEMQKKLDALEKRGNNNGR